MSVGGTVLATAKERGFIKQDQSRQPR